MGLDQLDVKLSKAAKRSFAERVLQQEDCCRKSRSSSYTGSIMEPKFAD